MSHGKPVTEQGAAPRGAARLAGAGPLQCRLETEAISPRSGPALLSPRALTHLPSSVPLPPKASPPFLQVSFRLCLRCESHRLSQCSSSVCDLGTRGLSGEIRSSVASVFAKQRHWLGPQSTARLAIGCPQFTQPQLSTSHSSLAPRWSPWDPDVTDHY